MFHHRLSALKKTSLLLSICHPASLYPTDRLSDLLHLSALAPTPLPSISQPASLNQTDTGQGLVHLSALAVTPLRFSEAQRETLSTPSYKIRKEKRAGSLVSPKDVTVISAVELEEQASVQPIAHPPAQGPSTSQPVSYVTSAQFEEINDKWVEHFARFEALLSRGNVFSTPKSSAPGSSHPVLSDQPFLYPSAR